MRTVVQIKDAEDLHGNIVTVNLQIEDLEDAQAVFYALQRNGYSLALRGGSASGARSRDE